VTAPAEPLKLYSTWRGLITAFLTPLLLIGVAALAVIGEGWHGVEYVLVALGAIFLLIALFDFPIYTTFDERGITRRTPLRAHRIAWTRVAAINRARGSRSKRRRAGPLAAAVGRRRYLLVDQTESTDEYEKLQRLCEESEVGVPVSALPPAADRPPTWLYHHRPQDAA
jgi:hypothetical protein